MSREIKCRALFRNISNQKTCWQYVGVNHTVDAGCFVQITEWEQFTGLKDKNGKEIYEGDVLTTECTYTFYIKKPNVHGLGSKTGTKKVNSTVVCEWDSYSFKFSHISKNHHSISIPSFEIIGNIHQDEHLIK